MHPLRHAPASLDLAILCWAVWSLGWFRIKDSPRPPICSKSRLLVALPDFVATPDGMAVDPQGNLVVACPNFADAAKPGCLNPHRQGAAGDEVGGRPAAARDGPGLPHGHRIRPRRRSVRLRQPELGRRQRPAGPAQPGPPAAIANPATDASKRPPSWPVPSAIPTACTSTAARSSLR